MHDQSIYHSYILVLGWLLIVVATWILWRMIEDRMVQRRYHFPALVPGFPVIGNTFQMPKTGQGPYLQTLGEKYGEMFTMKFGRTYWVFLNSQRVALELLEKRAVKYSSRQRLPMAQEIVSGGRRTLLMPYNDLWRRERRVMHQILNISQQVVFKPLQELESRALLHDYLTSPTLWYRANGRYSNSVIMNVVFGQRTSLDDPKMVELFEMSEAFVRFLMPGASIVDTFPVLASNSLLRSLQPWVRKGEYIYRQTISVYREQIQALKQRMQDKTHTPCFLSTFYEEGKDAEFSEEDICFIAGALMEAGSDTTRMSLNEIVASAALFPDWVERARKELDEVAGNPPRRLPGFEDFDQLPLIRAAIKESMRWRPSIAETGIPHALTEDDEFEGYRFPKGTIVTWNHWGIANNPAEYDEPERFKPERFLNEDLDKVTKGHLGFGAGRRVCVGNQVAAGNLFISIARLIFCFDFEQDSSSPIDATVPFSGGGTSAPFRVIVKPRSEAHRRLIEKECWKAAHLV